MEINKKELGKSEILLTFSFDWQEFEPFYKKSLNNFGKELKTPGFREGKTPPNIIEEKIGKEKITNLAIEMIANEEYGKYVNENKMEVVGSPKFNLLKIVPGKELSFSIGINIMPGVKLPDYKKIASSVEIKVPEVKDKEVDESLLWLQKSRTSLEKKDGSASDGDFVKILYSSPSIENNKVFEDNFFLGKGHFVEGFEEEIKGMKSGDKKSFEIKFPETYNNKDLAGKKVSFSLELDDVFVAKVPELNDDFAKSLGNFDTVSDLRKSIKDGIAQEKKIENLKKAREKILEKISEQTEIDVPEALILAEENYLLEELKENVKHSLKIPFDEYLKQINKTEEELKESMAKSAKERAKRFLILNKIGKEEDVFVSEEEISSQVGKFLMGLPETERAKFDINRLREYYKEAIYNEKVFQILDKYVSNNTNNN